jgi:hypothetical protein
MSPTGGGTIALKEMVLASNAIKKNLEEGAATSAMCCINRLSLFRIIS